MKTMHSFFYPPFHSFS